MLRSLFTGIAGLRAHQAMLDVTSNNIANVNTTGYKSVSATFEDTLSQTVNFASGATATQGSVNPNQIGLGVKLAQSEDNFAQGAPQATGKNTDVMVNGDGFFVAVNNGTTTYTRAGSLNKSPDPLSPPLPTPLTTITNLVEPDGAIIQGWSGATAPTGAPSNLQLTGLGQYQSWSIQPNGAVVGTMASGVNTTLGYVALATFSNPNGLARAGDTGFTPTAASGAAQAGQPGTPGFGSLQSGSLEMSNVDLAAEFTNLIISERGFQANSRVITTSDEVLQALVALKN